VNASADADLGNPALRRTFTALSGSIGASYALADGWRVGLNASHSERAPAAEELFANGPHAGTQAFEIGDPDLKLEKSWGLEATLHGSGDGYSFSASAYHSWFDNYIYDVRTGEIEDGLPVFQNSQGRARYYGFELEGSVKLAKLGSFAVNADALADYVRATIRDIGPAPRIPPLRLLGGLEAQGDRLQGRIEVEHVFEQNRLALNETPTDGYTLVNASLSFKPFADNGTMLVLSADNIFDVMARRHASFLKDYAPLAGRDFRISARFTL
jgi:iron complex outermembrane receptor protein